jgi:hypothetical protein
MGKYVITMGPCADSRACSSDFDTALAALHAAGLPWIEAWARAQRLVERRAPMIERIAEALLQAPQGRLSGFELDRLLGASWSAPRFD